MNINGSYTKWINVWTHFILEYFITQYLKGSMSILTLSPVLCPEIFRNGPHHHHQQQNRTPEMAQQKIVKVCPTSSSTERMEEGNGIETKRNSDMNFQLAILSPMYWVLVLVGRWWLVCVGDSLQYW